MKRILFVHFPSDLYGASRSLARLLNSLDRETVRCLVVLKQDGPLKKQLEEAGAEVIIHPGLAVIERQRLRSWRMLFLPFLWLSSAWKLRRLIRSHAIDLVHTNTAIILSSALAARWAGVPHVWHIRECFDDFPRLWPPFSRFIMRFSSRVICISDFVRRQFPPASPKCVVIYNGIDSNELPAPAVDRSGLALTPPGHFVIGTVGRIKLKRKGQEYLIAAAAILKQRGILAKTLIIGAPYRGNEAHLRELRRRVEESRLEEDVAFIGEVENPYPYYHCLDVFVTVPSQPEPFGGVILEAMAAGLPVIASDIGGMGEIVVDGETGFLVPPADPQALADKVAYLHAHPDRCRAMGVAGQKRVRETFTLIRCVREIEKVFSDAAPSMP